MIGSWRRFHPEEPDKEKRDGSGDRDRGDHIAAPVIVHANSRDGNEQRNDQERSAVAGKEKRERKKESPEMRGVSRWK